MCQMSVYETSDAGEKMRWMEDKAPRKEQWQ